MRMVVIINGIEVLSDLDVARISGTSVHFTDGSSCDIATDNVHNVGSGAIVLQVSKPKISRVVSKGSGTAIIGSGRTTL